ncbi:MAG: ABC transporter permease [Acidimicrobiia bacterium]|nr:ABC transporter permease [Acidimicrobiia bacterium]
MSRPMAHSPRLLLVRWSWRDLRARWLQVLAIALVIGIGSGFYSGLSSTSAWRIDTYDAAYDELAMWDLRVTLAEGSSASTDELLAAATTTAGVASVEARLEVPTQVDLSTDDQTILVPGLVIGVDVADGGPSISRLHPTEGRSLEDTDDGAAVVLLDDHVADHYDLGETGSLTVGDGTTLDWVGRGLALEHLMIIPPQGTVFGEAGYAVMWAPLTTAQQLAGRPGEASELVVLTEDGADPAEVGDRLTTAIGATFDGLGSTVTLRDDEQVLRILYDDIDADQRFNNVFAVLILAGAAFAAFNLTGRIVEAQRREFGIGMAMGVSPSALAVRPMLVGGQIALTGVIFGIGVGLLINCGFAGLLDSVFPMPRWITDFQPAVFARGAALGFVLPLVATLFPVLRAVRVAPVDAIRTGHRAASGGLAPLLAKLPLPGKSTTQLPFRNVLRSPRRTIVTALGIAAAITTLTGVVGMIDSFVATLDRGEEEILGDAPDRLVIDVDPAPIDAPAVSDLLESPLLARAEAGLTIGGSLDPAGEDIEVFLSVVDLESDLWSPTLEGATGPVAPGGIVLSRKAADDLGVAVGDDIELRHPLRQGLSFTFAESQVTVAAVHPNPFRFVAYMDLDDASLFGLEGITNTVTALPAPDVGLDGARQGLFGQPGVISAQPVSTQVETIRDRIGEFLAIFTIVQLGVLVLALLIAFNSTSINVDERRREHATMFAFGLPVRSVVRVSVIESVITGLLGTIIGVIAGRLLVGWLTQVLLADSMPDLAVVPTVAPNTVITAIILGVVAVAAAPLLTIRRLVRMDIPSTLRVME